ncbi:MAG: von Willebrand factor type A domain-containing protein [Opitutales bacterium]
MDVSAGTRLGYDGSKISMTNEAGDLNQLAGNGANTLNSTAPGNLIVAGTISNNGANTYASGTLTSSGESEMKTASSLQVNRGTVELSGEMLQSPTNINNPNPPGTGVTYGGTARAPVTATPISGTVTDSLIVGEPVQLNPSKPASDASGVTITAGTPSYAATIAAPQNGQVIATRTYTLPNGSITTGAAALDQNAATIAPTSQMLAGNPTQNTSQQPSRLLAQDFPDQSAFIPSASAGANPETMSNSGSPNAQFIAGNNSPPSSPLSNVTVQATLDYESQYTFRGKKVTNQSGSPDAFQPSAQLGYPAYGGSIYAGIWSSDPLGHQQPNESADSNSSNGLTTAFGGAASEPSSAPISASDSTTTAPVADQSPASPSAPVQFPAPVVTADNRFSTFALNVNDASYRLALAALDRHLWPQPGDVRTEEFLNAFNYHDPAPAPGQACALHSNLAQDPFETGRALLRVSFQTAADGRNRSTPLRLTILLDSSGSMTRSDRVATLQAAIAALGAQLRPGDSVSLVTFARTPQVRLLAIPAENFSEVIDTIAHLVPEGGTNLEEALNAAYAVARAHFNPNAQNRVILLTDGASNLGDVDPQALAKIVDQARRAGIALDAYGVGWDGYDDTVLEALTRHSDGRYAFLNRPEDVNDAFAAKLAGALAPAALDVKIQIEFNPARVTTYRLMGYNNLRLTQEQFRDNTVAAGELAAAEQGTALYSLVLDPSGTGPVGTARARFRDPATGEIHEWSWTLPYTRTPIAFDQASPALRLAAVAAYFAEYLQQSPYATEVSPRTLLDALRGVPEALAPDPRPATLVNALNHAAALAGP